MQKLGPCVVIRSPLIDVCDLLSKNFCIFYVYCVLVYSTFLLSIRMFAYDEIHLIFNNTCFFVVLICNCRFNSSQLAKMKKSIPDISLP